MEGFMGEEDDLNCYLVFDRERTQLMVMKEFDLFSLRSLLE